VIRHGDTVIDVGANVGCFTVLAARMVGAAGRVIAFEPEPESFRQLVANVEHNRLSNVTMRAVAIGLSNGTALLRTSGTALYSSTFESVDGRRNAGRSSAVQVRTLETMMREMAVERCHYLKMDCEGSEYEIVDSLSVNVASRIDQITLETHEVPGRSVHELSRRLRALGFRLDSGPLMYARRGVSSEMPREAPQTV
jgi:FkbM family methyltransferase